jgi:hypothetical protein
MGMREEIAKLLAAGAQQLFHGSTERGLKTLSTRRAIESPGTTFHTSNPDVADTFTVPREYGEPMFYDERGRAIRPGHTYRTLVTPKNLLEVPPDLGQRFIDDTAMQTNFIRDAKGRGHDAVVARNVLEGIGERYPSDVYAVTDDSIQRILGKLGLVGTAAAPVLGAFTKQDDYEEAR